mmetsp:Transcript_1432/g.2962  ORF Transcript_1432/g.2962 Transcript_1432/m.2962 type:complete len:101 (-) Transcript_1432:197-499(-)
MSCPELLSLSVSLSHVGPLGRWRCGVLSEQVSEDMERKWSLKLNEVHRSSACFDKIELAADRRAQGGHGKGWTFKGWSLLLCACIDRGCIRKSATRSYLL